VLQLVVSIRDRKKNMDVTGDPWNGRTLEWSVSSPPPFYNFATIPEVNELDAFWDMKQKGITAKKPAEYQKIHMPKNTPAGVFIGLFALAFGFALIWHIWWLAIVGILGIIGTMIVRTSNDDIDYYVPAEEVKKIEELHAQKVASEA